MKKLQIFLSLFIISIFLYASSCKKKEAQPDLPPYTETGANTFGCYIDGKPYAIFEGARGGFTTPRTFFIEDELDKYISYHFQLREPTTWTFWIMIADSLFTTGTYLTNGYDGVLNKHASFLSDQDGGSMPTSSNYYGSTPEYYLTVNIQKAVKGKQYSGTFEGELINADGKIIKIADGRFDLKK